MCLQSRMKIKNRTYAKSNNFGIFNPLNPPYQGDFERKCVRPEEFNRVISWGSPVRLQTAPTGFGGT